MLQLRRLDQLESAPLRGGEGAQGPFFSADSQWIGFTASDDTAQLKKVSVAGGPPLPLAKVSTEVLGATWLADGTIVVGAPRGPLQWVSEAGGSLTPLTTLDAEAQETSHLWPSAVPGTPLILFVTHGGGRTPLATGALAVFDRATGRTIRLGVAGTSPRYAASGHIVYAASDASLRAVRFDPDGDGRFASTAIRPHHRRRI